MRVRNCCRRRCAPPLAPEPFKCAVQGDAALSNRLIWERDGLDWPHREASDFVDAGGLRWHVQQFGGQAADLPVAVLIHGTGSSTHSWRGLAPLLAAHFSVVTMDLPGHGFTSMPAGGALSRELSLPGMAQAVSALLHALALKPSLVVGHSAGAAIAVRMCLDGLISPSLVISLNGAFLPLGGLAGQLFSPVAKLMAATPLVPRIFSWSATGPNVLQKLVDGTGSVLDATGLALYGKLVRNPGHAAGALAMMANWDLQSLARDLPRLETAIGLVVGANDRTISPRQARRVMALVGPAARPTLTTLAGLGHLAHEEKPDAVAAEIRQQYVAAPG
jgi:magnesium chelatase accessory protein